MAKSWREKFENGKEPKIVTLEYAFGGIPAGETMVVVNPKVVAKHLSKIKKGNSLSHTEFRNMLAKTYNVYGACPLSTAIFIRIVAEMAYEQYVQGTQIEKIIPFWRVVNLKSEKKYSFPQEFVTQQRKMEKIANF